MSTDDQSRPPARGARRRRREDLSDDSADEDYKPDVKPGDYEGQGHGDLSDRGGGKKGVRDHRRRSRYRNSRGRGEAKSEDTSKQKQGKRVLAISTRTRSKIWGQPDSSDDEDQRAAVSQRGMSGHQPVKEEGDSSGMAGLVVKVEEQHSVQSSQEEVDAVSGPSCGGPFPTHPAWALSDRVASRKRRGKDGQSQKQGP